MPRDLKVYAAQVLSMIYEHNDHERVHELLKARDRKFLAISSDTFGLEYLAARLALACKVWERCCDENRVEDEESRKALLRAIMKTFESSRFLSIATVFSNYLHAPDVPEGENPSLSVCETLFKRMAANPVARKISGAAVADAFQMLMAISESFRTSFENDFFEFLHA